MSLASNLSDDIPGLIKAALIFNGKTPAGKKASLAILTDGDKEVLLDLSQGLQAKGNLTKPMRSYISGLSQVNQIVKARKIDDEDGVTEDDIEKAALLFAFPKVGQNQKALQVLKSHLDAMQAAGVLNKSQQSAEQKKPKPEADAAPAADMKPAKVEAKEDKTFIERSAEKAAPLSLAGAELADEVEEVTEAAEDAIAEAVTAAEENVEEVAETLDDMAGEILEEEAKPSPAQLAQARLNGGSRKPSFFGR